MQVFCRVALLCLVAATLSWGETFDGTFTSDEDVQLFTINVTSAVTVTMDTTSYYTGGFDTHLTLFDGTGTYVADNADDLGVHVPLDPSTGNGFDSYLSLLLQPDTYTLALTEDPNVAKDIYLADGFNDDGGGDYTCAEFLGGSGPFCDASPSQRSSTWEVNIEGLEAAPTPEPGAFGLAAAALALLGSYRKFRRPAR